MEGELAEQWSTYERALAFDREVSEQEKEGEREEKARPGAAWPPVPPPEMWEQQLDPEAPLDCINRPAPPLATLFSPFLCNQSFAPLRHPTGGGGDPGELF